MARIGTLVGAAALSVALAAAGCSSHSVVTAPASSPAGSPGAGSGGSAGSPKSAQVGDTLELAGNEQGARMAVTVTAVADPATAANSISTPGTGERLVAVQFRLQNIGSAVYSDAPANSATVIDEQGQGFNTAVGAEVTAGPGFPAGVHIAPGDSALGYLAFDVPADSRLARAQFTLNSGFAAQTGQWVLPVAPATSAPAATATQTATVTATAAASPRPTAAAPRQVVEDYYAAINARDYARAWALGGRNLAPSYGQFVNGFAGTAADVLTVTAVHGDTVSVLLDALQTDGTHRHYAGTYTVRNGVIVAATVH
ncbi:DUF4352 domain-containing protein [Kitasatospora sp. DSM 101779]|uniref:DUF4352 domain-containing protein n=1 Tax=Kitasatospora sp. DSM 101779 TaxID=2853165 RepID=UPI0021DA38BB|nr:DUF4352 domain-containing protein [Kitasatospora sp. DSM 101779]MCU7825221.1 DUF4352 domain-containing protein [Kitasatospora sp. DSM 101779]